MFQKNQESMQQGIVEKFLGKATYMWLEQMPKSVDKGYVGKGAYK